VTQPDPGVWNTGRIGPPENPRAQAVLIAVPVFGMVQEESF